MSNSDCLSNVRYWLSFILIKWCQVFLFPPPTSSRWSMTLDYCEGVLLGPVPVSRLRHISSLILLGFDKSFPCAIFAQGGRFNSMLWRGFRSFWVAATTLSLEHSARMKFYPRPDLSPGHNAWVYVNLSSCVCLVSLFYSTLSPGWCPVTRHESGCK